MRIVDLAELTSRCIHCGLCLESCPTYLVTADESQSPRGRIHLVRMVLEGKMTWSKEVNEPISTCLGCLGCETSCPSGVEYETIIELAKKELNQVAGSFFKRALTDSVTSSKTLQTQLSLGKLWPGSKIPFFVSLPVSGSLAEVSMPSPQDNLVWPPLKEEDLPPIKGDIYMLEGCAMGVLFSRVNEATKRLIRRAGYRILESTGGCCGAMHAHQGYLDESDKREQDLERAYPGDKPIIVNAAGCGSTMKRGELSNRTIDLSEFLVNEGFTDYLSQHAHLKGTGVYHDACHLAHGQGIRSEPRALLAAIPGVQWAELEESDLCCGSAGIYNVLQPKIARELLDRKWRNITDSKADFVVLSNPGCQAWINQANKETGNKVPVYHIAELLEAALSGIKLD